MKRVLHVFAKLTRGGIETFVMNVYRGINRNKIQFDFVVSYLDGEYEDEVKSLGGRVYYIPPRNQGLRTYWKNWDAFMQEHAKEYVAIHQHAPTLTSLEPLYYAKKHGITRRIIHAHSSSVSGSKFHYLTHAIGKLFVKRLATHYLSCSDKAAHWLYDYTGIADNQIIQLRNGIDLSPFEYQEDVRKQVREELGILDQLVLGHVGRFVHVKNHPFLIDVVYELKKQIPNVILLLIGDGTDLEAIKQKVSKLDLAGNVLFLGSRPDVHRLLQAMDVFLLPSLFEGLPVTLIESQAAGLLTIVSDTVSREAKQTDLVHFFPLRDGAQAWADSIRSLAQNQSRRDMRDEMTRAGYDVNNVIEQLNKIYL